MIKVLLDTDIGTDVDDAVCLAYLLAQPQCELLGITTVTGEAEKRAALASVLCEFAGRTIPIFPGAEMPLLAPQRQSRAQQAAALPRWKHTSNFPRDQATQFMQRIIRDNPGEVILLTVGPLTNIAQLFLEDPEIPRLLKGLVMMGGVYNPQSPEWARIEWNTSSDPQASHIVFRAPLAHHRCLGLDVTQQVILSAEEVRERFTAPLLQPVLDFAEIWFAEFFPSITFHDPLAAATLFDPGVCAFQRGTVTLDMDVHPGRTYWKPSDLTGPHEVAVSVEVPRYFAHFFGVFDTIV
jgi:inosine-uridine nucleoside N-ribohydrolase